MTVSETPDIARVVPIEPRFITVADAALYLAVNPYTVYRLLKDPGNGIVVRHHGRKKLIDLASLKAYADSLPTAAPDPRED